MLEGLVVIEPDIACGGLNYSVYIFVLELIFIGCYTLPTDYRQKCSPDNDS